jgi:hypothetical protein
MRDALARSERRMGIPREVVTVHRGPRPDGFWRDVREVGIDGTLALAGTQVTVATAAILRPAR